MIAGSLRSLAIHLLIRYRTFDDTGRCLEAKWSVVARSRAGHLLSDVDTCDGADTDQW